MGSKPHTSGDRTQTRQLAAAAEQRSAEPRRQQLPRVERYDQQRALRNRRQRGKLDRPRRRPARGAACQRDGNGEARCTRAKVSERSYEHAVTARCPARSL